MKTTLLSTLIAITAAAGLTACSSVNSVERQSPDAPSQTVPDKRIITDLSLNNVVNILGVQSAVISTGFLKIQVELHNRTSDTQNFKYHIDWFDGNGMILHTTSDWVDRQILSQQTLDITAIAPTESAKDFRINLYQK